jgi:IS5 family transposase
VDAESGLVHTVIGTAANVNDVTQGHALLHGEETVVFADAGYQGASKRDEATGVDWHVAMRPGKPPGIRQGLTLGQPAGQGRTDKGQRSRQGRKSISGSLSASWDSSKFATKGWPKILRSGSPCLRIQTALKG